MPIYRVMPDGTTFPALKRGGAFVLNDPALGPKKHHSANEILEMSEDEVERRILRDGFSIRIVSPTDSRGSVIRNGLHRDGRKLT